MRNKIITSFFFLLLAVSTLAGLLLPDRYYSEREKRTLTQKPKFTVADFISGEFSGELEKYLTDQVPLRDGWVTMKTYMELAIGKRESGGVYICKDKYLMDKFTSYSKKQLAANAAALADLQEKLAAKGIAMNTLLVPVAAQAGGQTPRLRSRGGLRRHSASADRRGGGHGECVVYPRGPQR